MDKDKNEDISESFKNTNQSEKNNARSKASKTDYSELVKTAQMVSKFMPPPELVKVASSIGPLTAAIKEAQIAPKFTLSPEALETLSNIRNLYVSLNIPQLNNISEQIATLPKIDFQKIKNTICENRSQIYDAVQSTIETVSSSIEQSDQDNIDETLNITEQVAELVNIVDDSTEFPQPDSDKQLHIKKTDADYFKIISILFSIMSFLVTIAAFSYDIYQSNATTELLEKNHSEQMQATYKETKQLENLSEQMQQLKQLLEQIEENTSPN